jgi:hypothetical protein
MSEIVEHVRGLIAECDRMYPREDPFERRRRELAETEKRQQARAAREQRQASANWTLGMRRSINASRSGSSPNPMP